MKKTTANLFFKIAIVSSTLGLTYCGDQDEIHYRSFNQASPESENLEAKSKPIPDTNSPSGEVPSDPSIATDSTSPSIEDPIEDSPALPQDPIIIDLHKEDLGLIDEMTLGETKGNETWILTSPKTLRLN